MNGYRQSGFRAQRRVYDGRDKNWHQTWVDDRGTFAHYIGGLIGGKMIITADQAKPGKPQLARMTFSKLSDGTGAPARRGLHRRWQDLGDHVRPDLHEEMR